MVQHCHLCNWASNGLTLHEAIVINRGHENSDPEWLEMQATVISTEEIVASIHDHECNMVTCACKCGCGVGPFCDVMGDFCSVCTVRAGRGDGEHGEKKTDA